MLALAVDAHLGAFSAVLAFGAVVGAFGHIIKSRPLIIAGIVIIGATSVYFSFILQPGSS